MPKPIQFPRSLLSGLIAGALLTGALATPATAQQDNKSHAEQAAAEQKLADVRSKMAALAKAVVSHTPMIGLPINSPRASARPWAGGNFAV